jgi:Uma2 family endonuclease
MSAAKGKAVQFEDVGELLERLGDIPPGRVCMNPLPGTATEKDLLRKHGRPRKLYELVDGTLVEKPMGRPEAFIAAELVRILGLFVVEHDLGFCTGADDLIELMPKLVRGPDVCFVSWAKRPSKTIDTDAISKCVPDLVVEVLSPSNTREEMARKRKDYFFAGIRLVWEIDPRKRTAEAYTAPDAKTVIPTNGTLDGGEVVPGFRLTLAKLFEKFPATSTKKPAKQPKRKKK